MMELLNLIFMTPPMAAAEIYVWHVLLDKKINCKSKRFWLILLGLIAIAILNYYVMNKFIRIASISVVLSIVCMLIFRVDLKTGVIATLTSQLLTMIAETIFVIGLSVIFHTGSDFIENTQFGTVLANACIAIIVWFIAQLKCVKKLYRLFVSIAKNVRNSHFILIVLIFIIGLNVFAMIAYYKLDFKMMLIFNVAIMIIYFIIVMDSLRSKHDYIEVYGKYSTTISSLKEYEDILNRYRVSNHENKNQLLTIRNMVKNKDNKVVNYIDQLVENKLKDSENLMTQSMIIPEGGLRGLVYSKMLLMKEKEIHFDLSIDKSIRTVQLIELGDKTVLDICKIIGVFLDNAIEAVESLNDKFVDLEMSIDEKKLFISVTNNFEGSIDLEHIEESGFSTKGAGHGYGLSLVREIIEQNHLLLNQKQVSNDEFTQTLVVKLENNK